MPSIQLAFSEMLVASPRMMRSRLLAVHSRPVFLFRRGFTWDKLDTVTQRGSDKLRPRPTKSSPQVYRFGLIVAMEIYSGAFAFAMTPASSPIALWSPRTASGFEIPDGYKVNNCKQLDVRCSKRTSRWIAQLIWNAEAETLVGR